jgi:hypothetical protein
MAEKKGSKKIQTKAGMLKKKGSQPEGEKDEAASAKDSDNTPKISKEKAEGHHNDKPIH